MAVHFKFRSAVEFDYVAIEGSSISVRELRAKIVEQKNLKICQDFVLVITDAETGEAFDDENYLVLEGSSVIIKRVPAGILTPAVLPLIGSSKNQMAAQLDPIDALGSSPSANADMDDFDDFGIDLYSAPETSFLESDPDVGKPNCISSGKENNALQCIRCSASTSGPENLHPSDLSEPVFRGINRQNSDVKFEIEGEALQTTLKFEMEHENPVEGVDTSSPTIPNADMPSELRCSLCKAIFKEAVMIPCCQHSFCEKCIRSVLIEKARCPKCCSTRCKVDDLLPNVSLRQAIEHFLDSQVPFNGPDNILPNYVPDGESGIQVKEVSCAVSIFQGKPPLPHSPSATGKGSNQVMTESACESLMKTNRVATSSGSHIIHLEVGKSPKMASSQHRIKQIKGGDENNVAACSPYLKSSPERRKPMVDFDDDNKAFKLPQTLLHKEEASYTSKKKMGNWPNIADGSGNFMAMGKNKKGDRTCYMCGSPGHLVKDCPAASGPYPMVQTGDAVFSGGISAYGPPSYWPGVSLPHVRPFSNPYGAPGLMPFDPSVVPVSRYTVPPYMPPMYAGLPLHCGFMRMGGLVSPMVAGAERPLSRIEFMELQESERRRRLLSEQSQREQTNGGDDLSEGGYYEPQRRSHDHRPEQEGDSIRNYSEATENRRARRKHVHDKRVDSIPYHTSGFVSDDEDMCSLDRKQEKGSHFSVSRKDNRKHYDKSNSDLHHGSESSGRHSRERLHRHKSYSKNYKERREQRGSDSSQKSHHKSRKGTSNDWKRVDLELDKHSLRHRSHSETTLESNLSIERKRKRRDKEATHSSRHSKHKVKPADDQSDNDRWEMVDGLDIDNGDGYFPHKHKRTH